MGFSIAMFLFLLALTFCSKAIFPIAAGVFALAIVAVSFYYGCFGK